jgi:uncharacterized protein YcbK (DUF882 family)
MTRDDTRGLSRRGLLTGLTGLAAVSAAPAYSSVFGFLKGAGDVRRIKMYSQRTGEMLDTIYWIEGDYIKEALAEINWFMRDWRREETINYDARNINIISATQQLLETNEPFNLLSGYRSPKTNAMLRKNSRGVASKSYHIKGMAADLRMRSRSVNQMAAAARACNSGGVGKYRRSGFIHVDCGPVRTWNK